MAVRRFDGVDDIITVAPLDPNFIGAGTLAIVWRVDANANNGLVSGDAAGFQRWGLITVNDTDTYYTVGGFVDGVNYAPDTWYLTVLTKPAGSPATVRAHQYDFTAATWTHVDRGTVNDQAATGATATHFGYEVSTAFRLTGELAAAALWVGTELSDAECETMDAGLFAWVDLTPGGLWAFNQADVADPVLDLTGNGYDQTAITGTTVLVGDDPPGFDFSLTPDAPHEIAVDFPATVALATTTARDSQVATGHDVDLTFATTTATDHAVSTGFAVGVTLAVELTDPAAPPVNAPPLTATGAHDRSLVAAGAHDRTLVATGSHPT